jgi:hypothetical protein
MALKLIPFDMAEALISFGDHNPIVLCISVERCKSKQNYKYYLAHS